MGDENLEDAITPTPSQPPGRASFRGRNLRPSVLRDRPVIDPVHEGTKFYTGDPDPEARNQQFRNQLRHQEPTPGSPDAYSPFYDPKRFNYTALRSPYAREMFRDEIAQQRQDDAARAKAETARRREAERRRAQIQSQLEDEQNARIKAEKDRAWNLADLEEARTGREYIEDPDRPGYPRPVLSNKEWQAELEKRKAEETADQVKKRRDAIEGKARSVLGSYDNLIKAAGSTMTDSDYEKARADAANQIMAESEIAIDEKLKAAKKNVGLFKWGAKEKSAKQEILDLQKDQEDLNALRIDPDYVDKILEQNPDSNLITPDLRKEIGSRAKASELEEAKKRILRAQEGWKGNVPDIPRIDDDSFDRWLDTDHSDDPKAAPVVPAEEILDKPKASMSEVSLKEMSELAPYQRQIEVAKLGQQGRSIWSSVRAIDAEIESRQAMVNFKLDLVDSLRQEAGTTQSGNQISNDSIRAEYQNLQELQTEVQILDVRRQAQIDAFNQVVASQNRVVELAEAARQAQQPAPEVAVEVRAFPEDRESWVKEAENALKPEARPQTPIGSSMPAYVHSDVEKIAAEEKAAARRLAKRKAIAQNPNATGELVLDGEEVGWVEEKTLPNGGAGEIWNVYRENLQTAFPAAAGRAIRVVENPKSRLEIGESIFKTTVFDPFKDYKAPVGLDPEMVALFLEDTKAILSGGQTSEFAVEELQITPEKIEATSALIDKFNQRYEEEFKKSGVQDIVNQVAAGTLDEAEGERIYEQKIQAIYGPDGVGRERQELADQILNLRNAAFAGGGDFSQVIDLARKAGMSLEQPQAPELFIDEWLKENVQDTPISTDYMEAMDEYRRQNGGLVLFDPMSVLDYRDKIMAMHAAEEQLKNRLAEKHFSKVVVDEVTGMYGESIPITERRDLELNLEQEKQLQEMVREEARREGWSPKGFSDAPIRVLSGAVNMFPAKGIFTLGHMMGPGDSIVELARRPLAEYVEYGSDYNIWTEDTIRRANVGGGKDPQTGKWMPPEKINAVQYRDALEVFRDSQAYKKLPKEDQNGITKELEYISAVIGEDIENNPLVRWAQAVEESVASKTNPLNDRNYFAHGMTGLGSMGGFWAGGLVGRASLLSSGAMRGSGFIRRAVPEEKVFGFGPKSSFPATHPLGLIGFQGAMVNSTEGFRQLAMTADRAAADPRLDFDEQVSAQRSLLTMMGYIGLGYTEGLPIEKIMRRVDMTKVPPTFLGKFNNTLGNTLFEGLQEGFVGLGNTVWSEATLPTPGTVEVGGVDYGLNLGRSYSDRLTQRLSEEGVQIAEETAIGGVMGLGSSILENFMLGRRYSRARRRQEALIDFANKANEAKMESLSGPDAAEAVYENMPEGSTPLSGEELDQVNATYGGARVAAKSGQKSVEVMTKELQDANEKYGWDSPQAMEAELVLAQAIGYQGQDAGRRMGRQGLAIREHAEKIAQLDEDIVTAQKQFEEAQKTGGFVASAEADQTLAQLKAERLRLQQSHIATKIAQGRSEYISDSEWEIMNGDEELGVASAIEQFEGVPVVTQDTIDWATQKAPAQAALIEMSQDEIIQRIKDGKLGQRPTPELEQEIPRPSDRFKQVEEREEELKNTKTDEMIGQIPDYDPRMFRVGQGNQGPGEAKLRQAGPQIVEGIVRSLGRAFPNLTEQEIANVSYMLMERLAQRTRALEGAFRNVEVGQGLGGPAAVSGTGNLRLDPNYIIRAALNRIAEGASLKEAIDYIDGVVAEETTHNIVRWLLRNAGGDQRVAEIWEALSEETQNMVTQGYWNYTYNKAMEEDGLDLTSVPIENWPEKYQATAERALDPVYMGHEYLNMVIEEARTGQVSVALLPPKNFWDKLLDLLESLAEAIGLSLQDPNLDPDIRRQIEDIRDYTIEAMNQIEQGALNLFAEEQAPDTITSPKDRLTYLQEAGVPLMVAAQYRRLGISPQDLIEAAERGIRKASQRGGQNWQEKAIQAAQQEIEGLLDKMKVPAEGRPGTIRPGLVEKILSHAAKSEAEAWQYGEIIVDDIVKTLPTKQREVMERKRKGYSSKRIGKELGLNLKAVENIRKEAEKTIQKEIDRAMTIRDRQKMNQGAASRDMPTVYRGVQTSEVTEERLGTRNPALVGKGGVNDFGFFFTEDREFADIYRTQGRTKAELERDPGRVDEVKLSGNLFRADEAKTGMQLLDAMEEAGIVPIEEHYENSQYAREPAYQTIDREGDVIKKALIDAGYDGLVFADENIMPGAKNAYPRSFVVFEPTNIVKPEKPSRKIERPFPDDLFGPDLGAAPREWPQPRTILSGDDRDINLYIPTGYKHAKWGEGNKNDLTWIEDPYVIESLGYSGGVDALVTGVFRYGTGVTGMQMLAWLRGEMGPDAYIAVMDIVEDAQGFYEKAEEYGIINEFSPDWNRAWLDDEVPIQSAALRETPEEMTQIWSSSHPLTRNPDGTPVAWYRGHFDDDLFSIPSRPDSFLGPGVYFSNNVHDASQYADFSEHPDGAGEAITMATMYALEEEGVVMDEADASVIAYERYPARITPVYLHGKKWFNIDPNEDQEPEWSLEIDWELDNYRDDALQDLLADWESDWREEHADEVEAGDDRDFDQWVREVKEDEINEQAQEMAWETNYDPRETGLIAELFNGILQELTDSYMAEETLLELGSDIQQIRESLQEAKEDLTYNGPMTMTEVAQKVFGLNPMDPHLYRPGRAMIPLPPGSGGFLLGLGLKHMGYDGIMMNATHYFPHMAEVSTRDTKHALVFDAKPVYGMFGGVARKRRDPLQWASQRAGGMERVDPLITSKKSDIVDVARGKIYKQDMGTVTVRELLQNSLDAIRPQILKGQRPEDHKVTLFLDPDERTIEVRDTGHGMPPEVVASAMIDITKSVKETDGAGGYGLAKAVIFGNSESFEVETVYQERDGSWTRTMMTGDAQKWENTINEDPGGVEILTERNYVPGEGIAAKESDLKSEWATEKNVDLKGKYLPTGDLLPKGMRIIHNGYQTQLEVSPQIIPDLPEVFKDPEAVEEMAKIIADDNHPDQAWLKNWVELWIGSDRVHETVEEIQSSVEDYRGWAQEGITHWASEDRQFLDGHPAFDKDYEGGDGDAISRSFSGLISELPPPLQKLVHDNWIEKFGGEDMKPYEGQPEEIISEFRGHVLRARWRREGDSVYQFSSGPTGEAAFLNDFGWGGTDPERAMLASIKEHLVSQIGKKTMVTDKPSTFTRVRSKIHTNVDFNFAVGETTFAAIGENDTLGVEFEIGVTGPKESIDDLSEKTAAGRKKIRRIPNTANTVDLINEVNHTEAKYVVYRSSELTTGNMVRLQVLNRGIWQFEEAVEVNAQVRLPKKIVIDVHPNVDPKHDNYPFTAGRDDFHGYARWRHRDFYKDIESSAMRSKNETLKERWKASPLMTGSGVKSMRVVDVSGSNEALAKEVAEHDGANRMFAKMRAAYTRIQMALAKNGFPAANEGNLIAWNLGQDAVGVNYKTNVHVDGQDMQIIGEKPYAVSIDPSVMYYRATQQSEYLGLDQMETLARKMATDAVVTMIHEITHNGGYGDTSDTYSYQLTENISRMALEQYPIITDLAADLEAIFNETDLQEFLARVESQQDSNDEHDYAVFIQGTPTGRNGANKRLGRSLGAASRSGGDTESSQVGREGDPQTAERERTVGKGLPDLQAAAARKSINRRRDAFGNTRDRAGRLIEVAPGTEWPTGSGPNGGWNVISLFDGIAAGRQALKNLGVPVDNYFSSEKEPKPATIAKHNHPDIQELGDITKITGDGLPQIDLLWGGSPCQGFSRAGKKKGMEDPRSKLFWDWVRLWKRLAPRWFLLENVRMKPEDEAIITRAIGVTPVRINGNLLTASNRDRLFWTNIPVSPPQDLGVLLKHVIQPTASKDLLWNRSLVDKHMSKVGANGRVRWNNSTHSDVKRHDKAMALVRSMGKGYPANLIVDHQGQYRKFSMRETARLLGFPDEYLEGPEVADTYKYEGAGNSWAVPVIEHILQHVATQPSGLQGSAQRVTADEIAHTEYQMHAISMSGGLVHRVKHPNSVKWHVEVGRPERQVIGMFDSGQEASAALSIWSVTRDLNVGDVIGSLDHGSRKFSVIGAPSYEGIPVRDNLSGERGNLDPTRVFRKRVSSLSAPQREMQSWGMNFPTVQVHSTLNALKGKEGSKKRERHERAKAGDVNAALEIVTEVMKPEKALELASMYPGAVLATPNTVEGNSTNAIPETMAAWISHVSGMPVEESIFERGKASHTKANAWERLFRVPDYGGKIDPTKTYVLVDDVSTSGSTFNAMRSHIQEQGGTVVGSVAIASPNSPQNGPGWFLQPTSEALSYLDEYYRDGDRGGIESVSELLSSHGLSPVTTLTNSQVWLLAGGKPGSRKEPVKWSLDDLGRRLAAAEKKESSRRSPEGSQGAARRSTDLWGKPKQRLSSKDTARGNAGGPPAGYTYLKEKGLVTPGMVVLDIGTGPFRWADQAVEEMGGVFYSYEPMWEERTEDVEKAIANATDGRSDLVISNNVLNVIPEKTNQVRLIRQAENALRQGGKFYLTIYQAPKKGQVGERDQYQAAEPLTYYRGMVETVFGKGNVERDGQVLIATKRTREQGAAPRQLPEIAPVMTSKLYRLVESKVPEKAGTQQVAGIIGQWHVNGPDGKVKKKFPANQRAQAGEYSIEINGREEWDSQVRWNGPVSEEEVNRFAILDYLDENPNKIDRQDLLDFLKANEPDIKEIELPAITPFSFENDDRAEYQQYGTPGGTKYREILFIYEPIAGERTPVFTKEHGSHWTEPNVMYHARVSDRETPDGRKVLYVNEIQSDWHQKGKAKGYQNKGGPIPYAPWGDTWQYLAVRRLVQYASQVGGYDAIAFSTGDHQIDLNQSSVTMRVSKIETTKVKNELLEHDIKKMTGEEAWAKSRDNEILVRKTADGGFEAFTKKALRDQPQEAMRDAFRKSNEAYVIYPTENEFWGRERVDYNKAKAKLEAINTASRSFQYPLEEDGWRYNKKVRVRPEADMQFFYEMQVKNDLNGQDELIDPSRGQSEWVAFPDKSKTDRDTNLLTLSDSPSLSSRVSYLRNELQQSIKAVNGDVLFSDDNNYALPWNEVESTVWQARLRDYGESALNQTDMIKVAVYPKTGDGTLTLMVPSEGTVSRYGREFRLEDVVLNFADQARNAPEGETQTFEGDNLKIGGKMHQMIYDTMVPSTLKKIGRKHGVRPAKEPIMYRDPDLTQKWVEPDPEDATALIAFDQEQNMIGVSSEAGIDRDDFDSDEAFETWAEDVSPFRERGEVENPERRMDIERNGEILRGYPVLDTTLMELPDSLQEEAREGVSLFAAARDYPNPAPAGVKAVPGGDIAMWNAREIGTSFSKTIPKAKKTQEAGMARLDAALEWLGQDVGRLADPRGYVEFMRRAGVYGDIMSAPSALGTIVNRPSEYVSLIDGGYHGKVTVPGVHESARAGLDSTQAMKAAIERRGEIPGWVLLLHHAWGTLSKQATPVQQEGMWLRLLSNPRAREVMQKSIDGTFNDWVASEFTNNRERIEKATYPMRASGKSGVIPLKPSHVWSEIVAESRDKTSDAALSIGNQVTSQANDIFLLLSRLDGKWGEVEALYRNTSSKESGRGWNFLSKDVGALGIKNKVQRFIGLTFGNPGLIMDRWKFVEFWLPDLMASQGAQNPSEFFTYTSTTSAPNDPTGFYGGPYGKAESPNPWLSLAFYEGMEKTLQEAINGSTALQDFLGPHANVGGLHWHGWNAIKNEAVGHSSLDLSYDLMQTEGVIDAAAVGRLIDQGTYFTETQDAQSGQISRLSLDRGTIRGELLPRPDGQQSGSERQGGDGSGTRGSEPTTSEEGSKAELGAAQRPLFEPTITDFNQQLRRHGVPITYNEISDPIPENLALRWGLTQELREAIEQALGIEIRMISPANSPFNPVGGAYFYGRSLFIDPAAVENGNVRPIDVIGHEFTHFMAKENPALFKEFVEKADFDIEGGKKGIERLRDSVYMDLTEQDYIEEIAGDYLGSLFGERKFWQELAEKEPTLFEKVVAAFTKWLDDIISKLEGIPSLFVADAVDARIAAQEMLVEHAKGLQAERDKIEQLDRELEALKREKFGGLQAAPQRDVPEPSAQDAARILKEEMNDLAEFIRELEERKKQVSGEFTTGVPRLANISGDENVRAAHSIVQWTYDREREKLEEPDMQAEGRRMADETPADVERRILEAGANRTSLGRAEDVYAAKIVLARAWREATASNDPEKITRAQVLSHAYQRTRTEVARELAAGRDPSKTPAERHAEMIASFMGFSDHTAAEERRVRNLSLMGTRRDRIKEIHRLISNASSPEEANRYKNELKTLKEEIRAAEVDAEIQQKRMLKAKNVIGTYGVTLRDIFDGDKIRAARQAPAVKAAIERMRSKQGKEVARMLVNRQPNKKISKKTGATEEKIKKFEEDFRRALRLEFGKAAQQMAERADQGNADDLVLVDPEIRNQNTFHGEENGQFDVARPEHAAWAARTLAQIFNGNAYNAVTEFWINSILSGPQTQAINVFSNALNLGWDKTIQTGLESFFNTIIPGDKAQGSQFGDIRRFWGGLKKGLAPAVRNALASFKNDGLDFFESWAMQEPVVRFDPSKLESAYMPSIGGKAGKVIRTPGNALQAMDTLFKTAIAMGEVGVQAYRIANAQVKVGDIRPDQLEDRIAELMEHGSPAWELAIEKAKELTFTKEFNPNKEGTGARRERWMAMVQGFRGGKIRGAEESMAKMVMSFLFPFVRTPYRIFEIGLRKAPITGHANLLYKVIRSGISTWGPNGRLSFNANYGQIGRSELIRDITEQAIGTVMGLVLMGAAEGDEDDEDKPLLIVGSRPYAPMGHGSRELADRLYGSSTIIRIGGRDGIHLDYGRYEPISTVLSATIDMIREFKRNPNTEGQTWLTNLGGSLANQSQEKTFLQGIKTIADGVKMASAMSEGDPSKVEDMIGKTLKDFFRGFVPNLIRQPLRQLDPVPRDRSGYLYSLTNVGAFGLPKHDLYGRDLEKTLVGPVRLIVRTPLEADTLHPGDAFLSALSVKRPDLVSSFPTSWGGSTTNRYKDIEGEWAKMEDHQRNAFSKLAGQKFSLKVQQWVDPLKLKRPTEEHLREFKALLTEARREAKDQLFVNGRYVGPTR